MKTRHAFTLIELLVVIAIIGIVAAMVVNLNSGAQAAKRKAAVETQKNALMLMIDNYQSKLNYYPPDNTNLAGCISPTLTGSLYDGYAATNPLLYELTGATNLANGNIQFFDGTSNTSSMSYGAVYGRAAVNNSNPDEPHDFFTAGPKQNEYAYYNGNNGLAGLIVLVPMVDIHGHPITNYWHYDSSSTNRHNLQTYDLWAEFTIGSKNGNPVILTNGNW